MKNYRILIVWFLFFESPSGIPQQFCKVMQKFLLRFKFINILHYKYNLNTSLVMFLKNRQYFRVELLQYYKIIENRHFEKVCLKFLKVWFFLHQYVHETSTNLPTILFFYFFFTFVSLEIWYGVIRRGICKAIPQNIDNFLE